MDEASAWQLIATGDPTLFAIVQLSLAVSLAAVLLAAVIGLPLGASLEQSDATGWMGMFCLCMMRIALALARENPAYEQLQQRVDEINELKTRF